MTRVIHMAHKASEVGVSALCFKRPRAIDMRRATWTLRSIAVTCPKCIKHLTTVRAEAKLS